MTQLHVFRLKTEQNEEEALKKVHIYIDYITAPL